MDGSEIYSTVVSNLRDENFSIFPTRGLGTAGTDGDWRSPFERNPNVKVFVVFTAIFMILGSWGNTLVIGAFFVNKTIYTFRNSIIVCVVTWLFVIVTDVPLMFIEEGHVFDQKILICMHDRKNFGHVMLTYPLFILLMSCLICFCYYKIFKTVRLSKTRVAAKGLDTKDRRETIKLAKTLFVIYICFLIFWFPHGLTVLLDPNDKLPQWVYQYTALVVFGNSCLNFILYAQGNLEFRRAYAQLMCLGKWYNHRRYTGQVTPGIRTMRVVG